DVVKAYQRARQHGEEFSVPVADFIRYTEDDPDVEDIVRFEEEEFTGEEAETTLEALEDGVKDLFSITDQPPVFIEPEGEPDSAPLAMEPVLRPIELINRYRSDEGKTAFDSLRQRIKRSLKDSGQVNDEVVDIMTELQFRHLRFRAEALG